MDKKRRKKKQIGLSHVLTSISVISGLRFANYISTDSTKKLYASTASIQAGYVSTESSQAVNVSTMFDRGKTSSTAKSSFF